MSDSSSSRVSKKRFAIPSIDDIDKFENDRPKIPSNFKSKNVPTSHGASASGSGTQSFQSASALLASSTSARESGSKLMKGSTAGTSRTSNTGGEQDMARIGINGQPPAANQTAVSNEKAEEMKNSLELRRQRADEALRERLEAGASALAATSTTTSNLQRPRPQGPASGRLEGGPGSSSAGPSVGGRGVAPGYQYRPPQGGGRGKIGSSFANKFYMLGTAEEYKIPQAAGKPSTSETSGAGTSTSSNKAQTGNSIIVNPRQRGNPILKHIRNVPWEFGDVVPDYVMGRTTCAFYLSLRYHNLNPNYINDRLTELGHKFELRVLLVQVDVKDPHHSVKELARLAILTDCTLMLAWNAEEAGRYLETYKAYENKPADALKEKIEQNHLSKMTDCLTTVKSVNKTDVITLLANCGTFEKIVQSSKEELALLPGFGPQKAQRLSNIFTEPFLRRNKRRKVQIEEDKEEEKG